MTGDESIRILCPKIGCQRILSVPAAARGLVVRCSGCGSKLRIPKMPPIVRSAPIQPPAAGQPSASGSTTASADPTRRHAA